MVPNTGIKASSPSDEMHPQNMTATCFLSSQQIKVVYISPLRHNLKFRGPEMLGL